MVTYNQLIKAVKSYKPRSAWQNGVKLTAIDILEYTNPSPRETVDNLNLLEKRLLNGAGNWDEYSSFGMPLVYNYQIAERFCSPSELKKVDWGNRRPNSRENWIDLQARALYQAFELIKDTYRALKGN